MASAAFKSTSRRTSIGGASLASPDDSASTNRSSIHRRSRSLSRFSRRLPSSTAEEEFNDAPPPRGKFVNTVRGSGFPEISLDDLAIEFFGGGSVDRGRSDSRNSEKSPPSGDAASSQRRGRSVSRQSSRTNGGGGGGAASDVRSSANSGFSGGRGVTDSNARRRRSVSVVRYQISDSESDLDHSQSSGSSASKKNLGSGNHQAPASQKLTASSHRPALRRSLSQKELKSHDGYSSQSSVLTDDEGRDTYFNNNKTEKTIRAIYTQKVEHPSRAGVNNGLYHAMRKELRHAVEEIRADLEQAMVNRKPSVSANGSNLLSKSSDALHAVPTIKGNFAMELDQIIWQNQQRISELSNGVKDLLHDPTKTALEKPIRARKRSHDRTRISKRLNEEAEKYIEDFICNIEDTDISSVDGERSDTSSSLGGITKDESFQAPAVPNSVPVEMDGIVLPWLQWETKSETSPLPGSKITTDPPKTLNSILWDIAQRADNSQGQSCNSASSRGSWSPGVGIPTNISEDIESRFGGPNIFLNQSYSDSGSRGGSHEFDMEGYLKLKSDEDFLLERWRNQQRISSGGLMLCNQMFL